MGLHFTSLPNHENYESRNGGKGQAVGNHYHQILFNLLNPQKLQSPQGLTFISIQGYFLGAVLCLNIPFSIFCYRMKILFVSCYNFLEAKTRELLLLSKQFWEVQSRISEAVWHHFLGQENVSVFYGFIGVIHNGFSTNQSGHCV